MNRILDVPFRFQKSENSCFPTCISMVLKYYGMNIKPEILYKRGKLPSSPYNWDAALAPFIMKKNFNFITYWNGDIEKWKVKNKTKNEYKKAYNKALGI